MHIYFMRHGLATWPANVHFADDSERPLTEAGLQLLRAAGAGLARRLTAGQPRPDAILCSPLLRARQTAEIMAQALTPARPADPHAWLQPGFDIPRLDALISERPTAGALLLVGHNPDMMEIVSALTNAVVRFREGTVAHVQRRPAGRAQLVWSATAEELAAQA